MKAVILGCGRVGASEIGCNLTKALRAELLIAITRQVKDLALTPHEKENELRKIL